MHAAYKAAGADSVSAEITTREGGGFTAIASTGDVDRDGEIVQYGCFEPLPASVPVHLDHTMSAASLVGRARPYYANGKLMVDATLASTPDAQLVRQKVADGVIDSLSIVFLPKTWETVNGVRTCTKGELLAADLVSVPSNAGARILTARSLTAGVRADAILALAQVEIADAKRVLRSVTPDSEVTNLTDVRRFLRDL